MAGSTRSTRASANKIAIRGLAALLLATLPTAAEAKKRRPSAAELSAEGIDDPRVRPQPRRHRLRLALVADYVRLTQACGAAGRRCTRFHFAPLLVDLAYQLQFTRYTMVRPSLGFGSNLANSRNAQRLALQPSLFAGYQGPLVGFAAGYAYTLAFPSRPDATDGRGGLGQPAIANNHAIAAELTFTSRIDRGALQVGLRLGAMRSDLRHYDVDARRWAPVFSVTAAWFFGRRERPTTEESQRRATAR